MTEEKSKIIIDDDWKAQAQKEKEELSQKVDHEPSADQREIPPADFLGLVNALVSNIIFALGGFQDPRTKQRMIDLDLAKHYIDLLAVLEEKTKNNLTPDEKKVLDTALYEVRLQYVQIAQRAQGV